MGPNKFLRIEAYLSKDKIIIMISSNVRAGSSALLLHADHTCACSLHHHNSEPRPLIELSKLSLSSRGGGIKLFLLRV